MNILFASKLISRNKPYSEYIRSLLVFLVYREGVLTKTYYFSYLIIIFFPSIIYTPLNPLIEFEFLRTNFPLTVYIVKF